MNPSVPKRPYLVLLILCLGLYLPGMFTLPAIDRDEARFIQASRQMLEDGDFVRIRFQDTPRHKKPVGIYWMQAAVVAVTGQLEGDAVWPYRVPSVLGALLATLLTFFFGRRFFDDGVGFLGAALMAASLLLIVESHLAKVDAMLLASALAAQGALGIVYLTSERGERAGAGYALLFWVAQGVGILLKGPIVPLISLLTVAWLFASDRKISWIRSLRPWWGLPLSILIFSPWMISIHRATSGTFFSQAVGEDLIPKLIGGHESHGAPPGYYTLLVMVTFWPGSLFVWPAFRAAWKDRIAPSVRYCIAWIVPSWILFELVPTKLPHYVLPLYPALALLTARAAEAVQKGRSDIAGTRLARAGYMVWCVVAIGLAAVINAVPTALGGGMSLVALLPLGIVVYLLFYYKRMIREQQVSRILLAAVAAAVFVFGPAFQHVFPTADALWLSRQVREALPLNHPPPERIAAVGYHEPSVVFHLGTDIHLATPAGAATLMGASPDSLAIVRKDEEKAFLDAVTQLGQPVTVVDIIRGFNYTKGDWVTLTLYQPHHRAPAPGLKKP